jgi:hypothetical protein
MARTTRLNKRRAYKKRKATRKHRKSRKQYGGTCEIKPITELAKDEIIQKIGSTKKISESVSSFFNGVILGKVYHSIHLYTTNDQQTPFFSGEIQGVVYTDTDTNKIYPVITVLMLNGAKCSNTEKSLTIDVDKITVDSKAATHYKIEKLTKGSENGCVSTCVK